MHASKALRQQHLHWLPEKRPAVIAEHPFGLGIDKDDTSGDVEHEDGVRSELEEVTESHFEQLGVALHLQVRNVLLGGQQEAETAVRAHHRLARDVDMHQRTVLATS